MANNFRFKTIEFDADKKLAKPQLSSNIAAIYDPLQCLTPKSWSKEYGSLKSSGMTLHRRTYWINGNGWKPSYRYWNRFWSLDGFSIQRRTQSSCMVLVMLLRRRMLRLSMLNQLTPRKNKCHTVMCQNPRQGEDNSSAVEIEWSPSINRTNGHGYQWLPILRLVQKAGFDKDIEDVVRGNLLQKGLQKLNLFIVQ